MKIFGAMLVKNEKDIIRDCLLDMSKWIDKVFILDNGSTDGTWEIINSIRNDKIVPWRQEFGPYRRTLRAEVFNHFRHHATDGDWWYIADSDEFVVEDPREFLRNVPKQFHVVFKKSIDYFLTPEDVDNYEFTGEFEKDREIFKRINPNCWSEWRFFRYRKRMVWYEHDERPMHVGLTFPITIPIRHYQCRSPQQMQERIDIRNNVPRDSQGRPFRHVTQKEWRELLKSPSELILDPGLEGYDQLRIRRKIMTPLSEYIYKRALHTLRILP